MCNSNRFPPRAGFTILELVVVIAMIAILTSLAISMVMRSRSTSRATLCQYRLSQIATAVARHEAETGFYPPGTTNPAGPIRHEPVGMHHSWITHILPDMDLGPLSKKIDFERSVYDEYHAAIREFKIAALRCPAEPHATGPGSSYAGVHDSREVPIDSDNNAVFFLNSKLCMDDLVDGAQYTLFLGEKKIETEDLGWLSGTRATLRNFGQRMPQQTDRSLPPTVPEGKVGPFSSWHNHGINFSLGDGSIRIISDNVDLGVLQRLANRQDGVLAGEF